MKKVELLAPAGDMDALKAAISAGADSVYIGGKLYSARASASNFDINEIEKAVDYATPRGVKIFVTVNTLYKQDELIGVLNFIEELYKIGVNALIVQDMGLAQLVKKYFPNIALHASTQMTIHDLNGVRFIEDLGFDRVVLSREMKLEEIEEIRQKTKIEIETFIHGALCLSYSGQCLMSSFIGGRSGNRGRCAQPCRRRYELICDGKEISNNEKYLLSLKDICTLEILPELINAGINSFKIEGRMKKPEYVAGVVSTYRKYIDMVVRSQEVRGSGSQMDVKPPSSREVALARSLTSDGGSKNPYAVDPNDRKMLAQLFNRGNFSTGYYFKDKSRDMMSMTIPKNQGIEIGTVVSSKDCHCEERTLRRGNPSLNLNKGYMTQIKTNEILNPGDGIQILNKDGTEFGKLINKNVDIGGTFEILIDGKADIGAKVYRTYDKKLEDSLKVYYEKDLRKLEVSLSANLEAGKPIEINAWNEKYKIEVLGEIVEKATKTPITLEKVSEQLTKTGNTPFEVNKLDIHIGENAYINISKINEARRNALDMLEKQIIKSNKRIYTHPSVPYLLSQIGEEARTMNTNFITVLISNPEQAQAAIDSKVERIYLELGLFKVEQMLQIMNNAYKAGVKTFVALPYILRKKNYKKFREAIEILENSEIYGYLIRTYGEYKELENSKKIKVIDYNLNIFNNLSIQFWLEKNIKNITISPELNITEIKKLIGGQEIIVYGKMPVMFIEQCIIKNILGEKVCKNPFETHQLKDEKGELFDIINRCDLCLNVLYNSNKLNVLDKLLQFNSKYFRLNLIDEGYEESLNIIKSHIKAIDGKDVSASEIQKSMNKANYTKGHYFRGVE